MLVLPVSGEDFKYSKYSSTQNTWGLMRVSVKRFFYTKNTTKKVSCNYFSTKLKNVIFVSKVLLRETVILRLHRSYEHRFKMADYNTEVNIINHLRHRLDEPSHALTLKTRAIDRGRFSSQVIIMT